MATLSAASAARLDVEGGVMQALSFEPAIDVGPVRAVVDIRPDVLDERGQGANVTAYIEILTASGVADVDMRSVMLCRGDIACLSAAPRPTEIGDVDRDGIPDLMVEFDRGLAITLVSDVAPPATVRLSVLGYVGDARFEGFDTVRIVDPVPDPESVPPPAPPESSPSPPGSSDAEPSPPETEEPSPTPSEAVEQPPSESPESLVTDETRPRDELRHVTVARAL